MYILLKVLFFGNFVNSVERLSSPIYSVPPGSGHDLLWAWFSVTSTRCPNTRTRWQVVFTARGQELYRVPFHCSVLLARYLQVVVTRDVKRSSNF